jgi:uncharacterized RDD family membrane protein YckC
MTNLYAPPRAAVRDIVNPAATLALAERGTRLGASILDSVIAFAMIFGPFLLFGIVGAAAATPEAAARASSVAFGLVLSLVGGVAWSGLTLRFLIKNGQSIGKKLVGIKVVRKDGTPVSVGRVVLLRNVVVKCLSFIPFFGLVNVLFIFAESRQCLHDRIADTIVVVA